jgi:hypothetical protein
VTDSPPASGIGTYGAFLKDEIAAQDQRKTSFEQRGLAVVTTSGTLVTLLFALAALSTKQQATFVLPDDAQTWLLRAVVFFFVAAVAALVTNVPLSYGAPTPESIKRLLKETSTEDEAEKEVALARVEMLKSAKTSNSFKGWVLVGAMALEVVALGCVAFAVSYVI